MRHARRVHNRANVPLIASVLVLLAWLAVLSGRPAVALAAGLAFGLVRGLGVLLAAPARDSVQLQALFVRVDSWAGRSAFVAWLTCLAVAAVAAWQIGDVALAVAITTVLGLAAAVPRARSVSAG